MSLAPATSDFLDQMVDDLMADDHQLADMLKMMDEDRELVDMLKKEQLAEQLATEKMKTEDVKFAWVTIPSENEPEKTYVGYGSTYTEAILNAQREIHQLHYPLFSQFCPICQLVEFHRVVDPAAMLSVPGVSIKVASGNLYGMKNEFCRD